MIDELDEIRRTGLRAVSRAFARLADRSGYALVTSAADRHGAWEWAAASGDERARSSLLVGIVDSTSRRGRMIQFTCSVEMAIGLEEGELFGREVVARFNVQGWEGAVRGIEERWPELIRRFDQSPQWQIRQEYVLPRQSAIHRPRAK